MKRTDLEKILKANGWQLVRHGGNHDIWINGTDCEAIPRHREISEMLAQSIIKRRGLK